MDAVDERFDTNSSQAKKISTISGGNNNNNNSATGKDEPEINSHLSSELDPSLVKNLIVREF